MAFIIFIFKCLNTINNQVASTSADVATLNQKIEDLLANISNGLNASTSGTLAATSTGDSELALTEVESLLASESASGDINFLSNLTVTGDFTATAATVRDTLMSLGKTYLGDTNLSGKLNVDGTLAITQNSINVIGMPVLPGTEPVDGILFLQNSELANLIDMFQGAVTIAKDGTITTKGDVKVGGNLELEGAITVSAKAGEVLTSGDAVYVSAPGIVKKADATIETKANVIGIVATDAALNGKVTVIIGGKAKGLQDLQVGVRYYLGANGTLVTEPPVNAVRHTALGVAFSEEELLIQITTDFISNDAINDISATLEN